MATTTVRISEQTHRTLGELSEVTGRPMSEVLEQSVYSFQKELILDRSNAAYAELRKDGDAWRDFESERTLFEGTLPDGLENK